MKKWMMGILFMSVIIVPVYADGGFFFEGYTPQAEQAQQALVTYDNVTHEERLYIAVALSNLPGTNACWILTTPSLPEFEELSNFNVFHALLALSAPELNYYSYNSTGYYPYGSYYGCSCLGGIPYDNEQPGSEGRDDDVNSVTIWYAVTNRDYTVTVFSASTNVYDWLTNNRYTVSPEYKNVLDDYVSRGWYFTALQFDDFDDTRSVYVKLTFTNDTAVFPLLISRINSAPEQDIQLLLVSQNRGRTTNYAQLSVPISDIDPVETVSESFYGWDYLTYWDYYPELNALAAQNDYNAVFLEYSDRFYLSDISSFLSWHLSLDLSETDEVIRELAFIEGDLWLSRFYGKISTNNMRDIQLLPDENIQYFIIKEISIYGNETNVSIYTNYTSADSYSAQTPSDWKRGLFAYSELGLLFLPFGVLHVVSRRKRKKTKDGKKRS